MTDEVKTPESEEQKPPVVDTPDQDIEAIVAERLKQMKANLDKAYAERDAATKSQKDADAKLKQLEIEKLEAAGKEREAFEAKLKLANEQQAELMAQNTALTRDVAVTAALASHEFRSAKAMQMAKSQFTSTLSRNEAGTWLGEGGKSIEEAFNAFAADPDNDFLFKPKPSQGSGGGLVKPKDVAAGGSLFDMKQSDVIAGIKAGTLKRRR